MRLSSVLLGFSLGLTGCTGVPVGLQPESGFEVSRYLGTWHEIARLDHSFERGLSRVSAEYSLRPDEGLNVLNRGFDAKTGQWKEARGIARFIGSTNIASLKVSFFRPFWAGYHVFALDKKNYSYAMITGPNRSYLWILAREKSLPPKTTGSLVSQAKASGFDTSKLIWVEQEGH